MDEGLATDTWLRLRSSIAGLHEGNREAPREAFNTLPALPEQENLKINFALQYMAYAMMTRRIPERPLSAEASDHLVELFAPAVVALRAAVTESELRNAGRLALGLTPEYPFDPSVAGATTRLIGAWMIMVSVLVKDLDELDGLRSGADLWILSHDA